MELLIIVLLFALTISKDLLEFRTFSLNREEDLFYIRIALGLISMALIVAGIDRFEQWLEITYKPEIFFINDLLLRIPFNDLSVYFKYDHSFFLKAMRFWIFCALFFSAPQSSSKAGFPQLVPFGLWHLGLSLRGPLSLLFFYRRPPDLVCQRSHGPLVSDSLPFGSCFPEHAYLHVGNLSAPGLAAAE